MFAKYISGDTPPSPRQRRIGKCGKCGQMIDIPILPELSDPLYVQQIQSINDYLQQSLVDVHNQLLELAAECVAAGVRPSILKRADELNRQLQELRDCYGTNNS